jgi:hypothetical protein
MPIQSMVLACHTPRSRFRVHRGSMRLGEYSQFANGAVCDCDKECTRQLLRLFWQACRSTSLCGNSNNRSLAFLFGRDVVFTSYWTSIPSGRLQRDFTGNAIKVCASAA